LNLPVGLWIIFYYFFFFSISDFFQSPIDLIFLLGSLLLSTSYGCPSRSPPPSSPFELSEYDLLAMMVDTLRRVADRHGAFPFLMLPLNGWRAGTTFFPLVFKNGPRLAFNLVPHFSLWCTWPSYLITRTRGLGSFSLPMFNFATAFFRSLHRWRVRPWCILQTVFLCFYPQTSKAPYNPCTIGQSSRGGHSRLN